MKTLKVKESSLRETLKSAITEAHNEGFSGWRIPLYLESDGSVTKGSWLSQGSYQPDAIELPVKIERWDMANLADGAYYDYEKQEADFTDEDFEYEIEESVDWWITYLLEYRDQYTFELI